MRQKFSIAEEKRLRLYQNISLSVGKDYSKFRYGFVSAQYYALLRTLKINNIITQKMKEKEKIKILDVGCGTGILLKQLRNMNIRYNLTGIDFSDQMFKNTLVRENENITLIKGSAFETPFPDDHFDVVISTRFIHQYNDDLKLALIDEMKRITKLGGTIIVEFYSKPVWFLRRFLGIFKIPFSGWKAYINEMSNLQEATSISNMERIMGKSCCITQLVLPFHNFLTEKFGLPFFVRLNYILSKYGPGFLFQYYLSVMDNNKKIRSV